MNEQHSFKQLARKPIEFIDPSTVFGRKIHKNETAQVIPFYGCHITYLNISTCTVLDYFC